MWSFLLKLLETGGPALVAVAVMVLVGGYLVKTIDERREAQLQNERASWSSILAEERSRYRSLEERHAELLEYCQTLQEKRLHDSLEMSSKFSDHLRNVDSAMTRLATLIDWLNGRGGQ